MTSSTKPEVHNLLRCRQWRTEPRPQITCHAKCTENLVIWTCGFSDTRVGKKRQTNRQTDRYTRTRSNKPLSDTPDIYYYSRGISKEAEFHSLYTLFTLQAITTITTLLSTVTFNSNSRRWSANVRTELSISLYKSVSTATV